ncbi:MAG TPA: radical SAM family heme chaperone HemW [Anaerohalosphaeraceae bacterium]|mgnify:CR=1 FL=1|nr:radical SAM family heme chaperone HemW [Anaerohalosphaeraceae bacterium]HPC64870.1 radical SAM family heme chaperone HemW [Anaerohalosphaeraceae bacterium]HRS72555.1 radical SAM family heme chaperone HemW [Anaerohalosphaeraceae bacterium]HRV21035.1 radical SAM family heme chaperone HemW [Anaerohalosphaeraceae bacterium]
MRTTPSGCRGGGLLPQTATVGLYVHIPYCIKKCPYCAFYSEPIEQADCRRFSAALLNELRQQSIAESAETIYIGGGSPSSLPPEVLSGLASELHKRFHSVQEFTVECNPAQADETLLRRLRSTGVSRISIGAQSFHSQELEVLGRIHSPKQIADAVRAAQTAGFNNIGLDLIFGIPGSTIENWTKTLQAAMDLNVQHIAAYSLTIEPGTPFEQAIQKGTLALIDEQTERRMYETAQSMLAEAGFVQYEISNFAKPGFECRHNIRYWKNLPVVGIGPAAASWYKGLRKTNTADVNRYISAVEAEQPAYTQYERPSPEQTARETAVLNLRMIEGINLAEFHRQTGFDAIALFGKSIAVHLESGLLEQTATHQRLSKKGLSYADTVAEDIIL